MEREKAERDGEGREGDRYTYILRADTEKEDNKKTDREELERMEEEKYRAREAERLQR